MKLSSRLHLYRSALLFASQLSCCLGFPPAAVGASRALEVNYVSVAEATLRDRVAPVYNHVGTVKNGERVEVLEHEKRFSRVRTASGAEGWIEQRYLVDQQTYDALQKLTQENLNDPVQSPGVLRNETNLHITPPARPSICTSFHPARGLRAETRYGGETTGHRQPNPSKSRADLPVEGHLPARC